MREVVLDKQTQLSLPVSLPDGETFTSFYVGQNGLMIDALQKVLSDEVFHCFYLWSSECAGKSHLLYAACADMDSKGKQVAYIPLEQHVNFTPAILEGLDSFSLVCLDNIEKIAGNREWEVAIFNLYNNLFESHGVLLIAANALPKQLPFILPDLSSRLDWGQIYRMEPLSDVDKLQALQLRAKLRGFDLPDDVGNFLLKRLNRDMRTLFTVLDKLDSASIVAQRKMTIPFVKDSLDL